MARAAPSASPGGRFQRVPGPSECVGMARGSGWGCPIPRDQRAAAGPCCRGAGLPRGWQETFLLGTGGSGLFLSREHTRQAARGSSRAPHQCRFLICEPSHSWRPEVRPVNEPGHKQRGQRPAWDSPCLGPWAPAPPREQEAQMSGDSITCIPPSWGGERELGGRCCTAAVLLPWQGRGGTYICAWRHRAAELLHGHRYHSS